MERYNRDRFGSGYGDDYYDRYSGRDSDSGRHNRYYDFDRGDRYRDDRFRDRDRDNRLDPETRNKFERVYRERFENDNRYNRDYQDRDRFRNNYRDRDEDDRYTRYDARRDWSGSGGYSNNDQEYQMRNNRERRGLGDILQVYGAPDYDSTSDRYNTRNSRGRSGMDYDQGYYSGGY
ncbi:hypothetical protein ACFSRY_15110 [Pontibacter locisalis]|uniref:Uncharacterized protein n=1 Tax=Pontibacter locisalis TaxID=1719035 RepID=A0ABW5INH6_9BACT